MHAAATAVELKAVRIEVTSMSPVFKSDRLTVSSVLASLYKDAKKGLVPYGFINSLKRELKRIGFDV
jgi:hypothetical protein